MRDGGTAAAAILNAPTAIAVDASNNLYISDSGDGRVRVIYAAGIVAGLVDPIGGDIYTVAGTGTTAAGSDGLQATRIGLSNQIGQVAFDLAGDIYIPDTDNNAVLKIDRSGIVSTIFGNASAVCAEAVDTFGDGCPSNAATVKAPTALVVSKAGILTIADGANGVVRQVSRGSTLISFVALVGGSAVQAIDLSNVGGIPVEVTSLTVSAPFSIVPLRSE